MSLDDTLRDLMDERSQGRPVPAGHLDRIHRRLVRRRNRRVGTATAGTVLAVAALTGTAITWPHRTTSVEPPTTVGESATPSASVPPLTLPAHNRGQSLIEQKLEPLSPGHGEFTLLFTPRQWNFSIAMDCVTTPVNTGYQIEILINGSRLPYGVATCNEGSGQTGLPAEPATEDEQRRWWQHVHDMIGADTPVRLNEPMTITVRVGTPEGKYEPRVGSLVRRSGPFTARSGQAIVGIYQPG
jgi:hypothetical protein